MNSKDNIRLFFKSQHFCAVPWNYFKVWTDGSILTCVRGSSKIDREGDISVSKMLQTNITLQTIRKNLYNDILDSNCASCQSLEQSNYKFLRGLYNDLFKTSTVDYSSTTDFICKGVDLHWGSTCQLKCITCWAEQSSSIAKEQNIPIKNISTDDANNIIDIIVKNQEVMEEIYLSGGEPTLIKHNLSLLQQLDETKLNSNCIIRVNTNMMFDEKNSIVNELLRFPNVLFTISADGLYERFEYIRRGAKWNTFINNLNILQKTHFKWRLNIVFFVGSALTLPHTHRFFIDNYGITDLTINQLTNQKNILCRNLSDELSHKCKELLLEHKYIYKDNKNLGGQIDNCITELSEPAEMSYISFFEYFDKLEGTNWKQTFKELI